MFWIPYEAVIGANELEGTVVGYSPARSMEDHVKKFGFPTEGFTHLVFLSENCLYKNIKKACLKQRNLRSVMGSDTAIIIGGRWETVNEFSLAYDLGRNIGVLEGTGGFSRFTRTMIEAFDKKSESRVIYHSDPARLVGELERITVICQSIAPSNSNFL